MKTRAISITLMLFFILGSIAGCATVPPAPQTAPQKLIYSYGTIEGLANTVETLYRAEVISKKEAQDAFDILSKTWHALDEAEALYDLGQTLKGQASLNESLNMLETLRVFLLERSKQ